MTIMELAAIPLWTLGVAGVTTGALALVLCAFADDSLFIPDLSRRKILIWGLVLVTGSARASCSLAGSACRKRAGAGGGSNVPVCPLIHHPLVFIKLEKKHEPHPRALSSGSTMRSKQSNGGGRVSMRVESC